ncbi:delta(14)-sterol reductase TM7SF2 [Aplysia californica]|uniref:Delta(14)-sterol reductase TM7SF2 n=1 Tax=Aplysia californica TaxID=6500 RepID=A0ABM1AC94_APLCA|nr:delta(14)-sterol reductase TM7SF2 [Aplysia californica]
MAPTKKVLRVKESGIPSEEGSKWKYFHIFITICGPLFLIYLNLRCEKNQCVLFQLPLVVPTHVGAYFSTTATLMLFGFFALVFLFSLSAAHSSKKEKSFPSAFYHGSCTTLTLAQVELKYFFYVHVGLVALALLDLLVLLDFALKHTVTAPLAFLATTQYLLVAHTLLYESFLMKKPFIDSEKLGFFWLLKVLLYLPFFHSLPVLYTSVTEIVLPKPAMLADCVLFLFGFIIYTSSIHQKENFAVDPNAYRSLKSITVPGRRLLISGYWGIVQKPDYLGYMIIWLSWIIACGLSGLSLVVLTIIYITMFVWLHQAAQVKKTKYHSGWTRYINVVPKKVIPYVY